MEAGCGTGKDRGQVGRSILVRHKKRQCPAVKQLFETILQSISREKKRKGDRQNKKIS